MSPRNRYDVIQVGSFTGHDANDMVNSLVDGSSRAIFIEPHPEAFKLLVEGYNSRYPNNSFSFINSACSNEAKESVTLYYPDIPLLSCDTEPSYIAGKVPWFTDQLTSVLENHVSSHHIDVPVKSMNCACTTLTNIVKEFNISELDLLCVDTEGHDYEVLLGLDYNILKPRRIIFEHSHMDGSCKGVGPRYDSIISALTRLGYRITHSDQSDTHLSLT
jgi:FkbM family methyltransferase